MAQADADHVEKAVVSPPGLKKVLPYWYPYTTMAKMRWLGRELLEVVSTEFRDRSMEYYRYALESGVTTVNGMIAQPNTVLRDGDRIENVVHRHEPPVSSRPVKILYHDPEREFIVVDKPGSIPVHASGRYYKNTLIEILVSEFGFAKVYPINRLDRLTSGLMIIPLSADRARKLTAEFVAGTVQKEYAARCKGRFPDEEIICEEPLLTVDRQMGLNIVHPEGKPAKTIFNLIRYDANTDSSVVRCRPLTGRSHQIRVHLQFLGYPIANDPVYSEERIWGENVGKGGIDITPSEERSAPAPPEHLQDRVEGQGNPESLTKDFGNDDQGSTVAHAAAKTKLLPRETGQDIGMGSPVPLSKEAVGVITKLRNMKDEDEDWSRWRDVIFRAKGALSPSNLTVKPPPPQNRRKRGGKGEFTAGGNSIISSRTATILSPSPDSSVVPTPSSSLAPSSAATPTSSAAMTPTVVEQPPQLTTEEALEKLSQMEPLPDPNTVVQSDNLYCPECYLPLHPDPKPEKLYIFLHALKYTTSLGSYETDMPEWAVEGYEWDRS
ncbi:pseudouridine synthase [Macrolepiota fuliginosa MF-IS2]|uniref:Pseudouridine synthase n=1 Tax=Macrolepiota fuliginosa MF-IS2 TaxID=1400762 RepID=A0A9P5XEX6_9AGAR|nr:pseudouridine synthase [Macrolepiota fuliginosa MF-IS2]